ncbi:phage protein [Vibrio phage pTD1]|uniref:Phage protein n=1 Tax=Vibrio phage pTD1 TaxID=1938577 RepID=A0A1Q2U356_9CAUD|nr:phage protein [Vibrio phage pTD1]BAW98408.1 phage protein [Vibrio phage pTD1]
MTDQEFKPYHADASDQTVKGILQQLFEANRKDEEDPSQRNLVSSIQQLRGLILDNATAAYLKRPNDPKLLDALNSLVGALEKSVRDDRKEAERNKDREENRASFNQMIEALGSLNNMEIQLPTWGEGSFIINMDAELDELLADQPKIREDELVQGQVYLDFDGEAVS